jgi:hypothetical protein
MIRLLFSRVAQNVAEVQGGGFEACHGSQKKKAVKRKSPPKPEGF